MTTKPQLLESIVYNYVSGQNEDIADIAAMVNLPDKLHCVWLGDDKPRSLVSLCCVYKLCDNLDMWSICNFHLMV